MNQLPVVLGGAPTWAPKGEVRWDRWGGTAPSWDPDRNIMDPNAIEWPMRRPGDVAAAAAVAAGTWAYLGPHERAVQRLVAERKRSTTGELPMGCMVNSGTGALQTALGAFKRADRRAGIVTAGPPEMITTALSFQASWATAAMHGYRVVPVDVDPETLVPTVAAIRDAITRNTRILQAVAMYGAVPELDGWRDLADERLLWLLGDNAHAPFGTYLREPLWRWLDVETNSNQLGKDNTSGEGGSVWSRIRLLAGLAIMISNVGSDPDPLPDWWPVEDLGDGFKVQGHNLRYAEPQAALLEGQLAIYDAQLEHKEEQYEPFIEALGAAGLPFTPLKRTGEGILYKVGLYNDTQVPTEALRVALRRQITGECNSPYPPISEPASGFDPGEWPDLGISLDPAHYPNAYRAWKELLMLPHDFFLRRDAADHLIDGLTVLAANENALVDWAKTRS